MLHQIKIASANNLIHRKEVLVEDVFQQVWQ